MRWMVFGGFFVGLAGCREPALELVILDGESDTDFGSSGTGSPDPTRADTGDPTVAPTTDPTDPTDATDETTESPPQELCPEVRILEEDTARTYDIADLDGDGIDEVLAIEVFDPGNGFEATIASLMIRGDETFAFADALHAGAFGGYAAFADVDGDGLRDLVVTEPDGPTGYPFKYYPLQLTSEGLSIVDAPLPIFNPPGQRITWHEIGGDGIADLLGTVSGSETLAVSYGLGNGDFSGRAVLSFPNAFSIEASTGRAPPGWVAVVSRTLTDFGCLDARVSLTYLDDMAGTEQTFTSGEDKYDLVLDVVDGDVDGFPDVFARTCIGNPGERHGIATLRGGAGGLVPVFAIEADWAEAGDFDGDGDVDFVTGVEGSVAIEWLSGLTSDGSAFGGEVDPAAEAVGHGRFFAPSREQVLLRIPAPGGATWAYVTGTPC